MGSVVGISQEDTASQDHTGAHTHSACVRPVQLLPGGGGAHLPSAVGHGRDRPARVRVHPGPGTGAGLGDSGERWGGDQEDQGEQWNCWRIYWRLHTEHTWGLVLLWSWLCSWYSLCCSSALVADLGFSCRIRDYLHHLHA